MEDETVGEIREEFNGFVVTGRSIGEASPYKSAGRVKRPLDFGELDQPIEPSGQFETRAEAASDGLARAKLWVINNNDPLSPKPSKE